MQYSDQYPKNIFLVNPIELRSIGKIIQLLQCYIYIQMKFANKILEAIQLCSRYAGPYCRSLTQGSILGYLEAWVVLSSK